VLISSEPVPHNRFTGLLSLSSSHFGPRAKPPGTSRSEKTEILDRRKLCTTKKRIDRATISQSPQEGCPPASLLSNRDGLFRQ
jgi:hypothetical protein